jgi:hypothetical protein
MANNLKGDDAFQVLRSVFDVDKNCLRVCIVDGAAGGGSPIEVIVDHTTDSIRLGDGTTLFSSTAIGTKTGLDVSVINNSVGQVPDTDSVSMVTSGTEYNYVLPIGTKWFEIRSRFKGTISFGYSTGNRNFTVIPGNTKKINDIIATTAITIYVSSTKGGDTLEIHYWI